MPSELEDYSCPFKPDLTFNDFSKEFLLKLIQVWQFGWLHMASAWYEEVKEKFGSDAANTCNLNAWVKVGQRVNPRFPKIANIKLETVLDSLKCMQLPLDNPISGIFPVEVEIKNPNHVIWTVVQCRSLLMYERSAPEMIQPVCHELEEAVMRTYLLNPKIKVKALKLPPRKSPEDIACQWEFTLDS